MEMEKQMESKTPQIDRLFSMNKIAISLKIQSAASLSYDGMRILL